MSVAECQQRVSSAEFTEWVAYHSIDPWSRVRDDWGHAMVAAVIANANTTRGRRFTVRDFLPDWEGAGRAQTHDEIMSTLDRVVAVMSASSTSGGAP